MKLSNKRTDRPAWKNTIITFLVVFTFLFGAFLYLLYEGINIISATQTFTAANSQWAQTQKDAVSNFYNYARNHNEEDFTRFKRNIEQVYAIREAIDEISEPNPDIAFIREGLSSLQISNALINNMLSVRRYLGSVELFTASHSLWEECGVKISMIEDVAHEIHDLHHKGELDKTTLEEKVTQIRLMDRALTAELQNILVRLGESSEWLTDRVLFIIAIAGLLVLLFALAISYYWYEVTSKLKTTLVERDNLSTFPELNPMPVVEVDFNCRVTYCNPAATRLFPDIDIQQNHHPFLKEVHSCIYDMDKNTPSTSNQEVDIGDRTYEQVIHRINEMEVYRIYGFDITDRKKYEREINKSLKEKEVLLAEIHHRVKNNLAVVAGLLELEGGQITSNNLKQVLTRSISRIHSIALIHEKLYEFKDFSNIDFKLYLEELIETIENTYRPEPSEIHLSVQIDVVSMNVNQAVPLGIIINEVLINAYKHAFRENGLKGNIHVTLHQNHDKIRVCIHDNGTGLPSDFNFEETSSLGMTLIKTLASQLKAEIVLESNNGTRFQITFQQSDIKGSSSSHVLSTDYQSV